MMRETIDFGIDLGTTNSVIAVLSGADVQIIKNNEQAEFTPSAVWINKNNKVYVGRPARERIESDPQNACGEFKLKMGMDGQQKTFEATGRQMSPEELSAEVVKSLKVDAQQCVGEQIQAAVITVPAAFELNQCDATRRAANLAGLELAPLLQEPTAAGFAYSFQSDMDNVFWLVYDFGGGTFDGAIIHLRDGEFSVVNHCGDNYLGGKLIDWAIVEKLLIPAVVRDHGLPDFTRGNPKWFANIAKLKLAAENAKIRLSRVQSEDIVIELENHRNNRFEFTYELRRGDVERLAEPFYVRSINLCKQALTEKRLDPGNIEKILLVGGSTLAPYLRERLPDAQEGLGIPVDHSLDPVTVVARGAAIFAGTQRFERSAAPPNPGEFVIDLEYEPIGVEIELLVGGRVRAANEQEWSGFTIQFSNPEGRPPWFSGKIELSAEGTFMTRLLAKKGCTSTFLIEFQDPKGRRQTVTPDRLTYTQGIVSTDALLTHSIGVGLANREMQWFLRKGETLPARKRVVLRTTVDVRKGVTEGLIRIPVMEGELARAHRNRQVGTLEVTASEVVRDVPAGSEVEVTIQIDPSRLVTTRAYVPILDEEYEQPVDLGRPAPRDPRNLRRDAEVEQRRLEEVRMQARAVDASKARELLARIDAERMVEDIDELVGAAGVDSDAAATCERRVLDLGAAVDDVEDALRLPQLAEELQQTRRVVREVVDADGDETDRQDLRGCEVEIEHAMQSQDVAMLKRQQHGLWIIARRILDRTGQLPFIEFENLKGMRSNMVDLRRGDQFIAEGEDAIARRDVNTLRSVNVRLYQLLPPDEPTSVWLSTVQN